MTHSPADVTRQLFIDIGLATDIDAQGAPAGDWPVFESGEPDRPDESITIFDYEGPDEGSTMYDGEIQGLAALQIRVRSKTKRAGYAKANTIAEAIAKSPQVGGLAYNRRVTVAGVSYLVHCYSRIGNVIPLGKESLTSTRRIFVVNCLADIRQCG